MESDLDEKARDSARATASSHTAAGSSPAGAAAMSDKPEFSPTAASAVAITVSIVIHVRVTVRQSRPD